MQNKFQIILTLLLSVFVCISAYGADSKTGAIEGEIYINRPGTLYIYLVDEKSSDKPLSGTLIKIDPGNIDFKAGFFSFTFSNLNSGNYGIRCFQDLNNNGKLDKGLFGPTEPWGFSWNIQPPPLRPAFSKYCHDVDGNVLHLNICLNEKE